MNASPECRYLAPTGMDRMFNSTVAALTRAGISIMGSRVLAVRGRKSGEWRTTPVNLLTVDGTRYLVAPRGQAQWVRNLRAAGRANCGWAAGPRLHRHRDGRRGQAAGAARLPAQVGLGGRAVLRGRHSGRD